MSGSAPDAPRARAANFVLHHGAPSARARAAALVGSGEAAAALALLDA